MGARVNATPGDKLLPRGSGHGYPSLFREQAGASVRFIVWEDDAEIRHGQMLIGLRTSEAHKQISDDIQVRRALVVRPNTIQGESGLEVRANI